MLMLKNAFNDRLDFHMAKILELITRTSILGFILIILVLLPFFILTVALIIALRRRESANKNKKGPVAK